MAQAAKQSDNYNFTVEATPSFMQLPDGTFVKDGFTINRRTDNHAVLGKVTDRYGLIQNNDLISVSEDAFKAKGMTDYKRTIITTGQGEKMYANYDFRSKVKKLNVGDEVGMRLTVQNSHDGSIRACFGLGSLRLVCSNGMVSMEREVSMAKKHSSGINVDFITKALERAIIGWDRSIDTLNRLAGVSLTQVAGTNILSQLEDKSILSGKLRENIQLIWNNPTHQEDKERNLFNLYNAVTQHLTHDVSKERFELSNRVNLNVLNVFERLSRDPSRLSSMILPVSAEAAELALN